MGMTREEYAELLAIVRGLLDAQTRATGILGGLQKQIDHLRGRIDRIVSGGAEYP